MPKRIFTVKPAYKRRYKRRYKYRKKYNKIGRLIGLPKSNLVKMRYSGSKRFELTEAMNIQTAHILSNGIIDPEEVDLAAPAHSALGSDEWAKFYDHWTVLGSKITISVVVNRVNGVASDAGPLIAGVYLCDKATPDNDTALEITEQGKSRYKLLQTPYGGTVSNNPGPNIGNGNYINKLGLTYSAKKWHGVTNVKDCAELEGDFGQIAPLDPDVYPSDKTYYILYCGPYNSIPLPTGATATVDFFYQIDYIVHVKDPQELRTSGAPEE